MDMIDPKICLVCYNKVENPKLILKDKSLICKECFNHMETDKLNKTNALIKNTGINNSTLRNY